MRVTKVGFLLVGIALGVSLTVAMWFIVRVDDAPAAKPVSTATVTLTGTAGRYLQFTGRETSPFTFRGSLAFRQTVKTGSYTLSVTLRAPTGKKTRLVYDIRARQR